MDRRAAMLDLDTVGNASTYHLDVLRALTAYPTLTVVCRNSGGHHSLTNGNEQSS